MFIYIYLFCNQIWESEAHSGTYQLSIMRLLVNIVYDKKP